MGEMLDEMSQRHFYHFSVRDAWEPSINMYETGHAYLLCMDLAGMNRDQIDVREMDGKLYIRGNRPTPQPPDDEPPVGVHLMEIDSGPFQRKIAIPSDVNRGEIRARYRDGFLWVTLPRITGDRPEIAEP
jgi:HSP20 family molecular chaperone IbpA